MPRAPTLCFLLFSRSVVAKQRVFRATSASLVIGKFFFFVSLRVTSEASFFRVIAYLPFYKVPGHLYLSYLLERSRNLRDRGGNPVLRARGLFAMRARAAVWSQKADSFVFVLFF